jgi:uncharacterized phosphatase
MTQICLIRHGETDWNRSGLVQGWTDIPLNARGRAQARIVGQHLSGEQWDMIYASPLSRAYDTASIIAERVGIREIHTDPRLQERNFGEAEGMMIELRKENYRNRPIPGAESWEEVHARAVEVMEHIALLHRGNRILAVAHGGFIAGLLHVISGGEYIPGNPPLKNTCMNMLVYDGNWRIEWFNRVTPELELLTAGV